MTETTMRTQSPGFLSWLADLFFGSVPSTAEFVASQAVALTIAFPDGRRETVWTRSEPGRTVGEQIDEILVKGYGSFPDAEATLVDVSLSEAAPRRWVVSFRETSGVAARIVVMASNEHDADLRGRFAVVARGLPPVAIEDLALLHEIGERMETVSIDGIEEEPVSYDDFRSATDEFVRGLKEGKTPDQAGLAAIEELLSKFARA